MNAYVANEIVHIIALLLGDLNGILDKWFLSLL